MKDYKELVEKLRRPNFAQKVRDEAADAIEQLVKERDYAMDIANNTHHSAMIKLQKNDETIAGLFRDRDILRRKRDELAAKCSQLEKESDAAIADLGKACYINLRNVRANACHFCLKLPICEKIPGKQNYCCADWEWRGVQEVAK